MRDNGRQRNIAAVGGADCMRDVGHRACRITVGAVVAVMLSSAWAPTIAQAGDPSGDDTNQSNANGADSAADTGDGDGEGETSEDDQGEEAAGDVGDMTSAESGLREVQTDLARILRQIEALQVSLAQVDTMVQATKAAVDAAGPAPVATSDIPDLEGIITTIGRLETALNAQGVPRQSEGGGATGDVSAELSAISEQLATIEGTLSALASLPAVPRGDGDTGAGGQGNLDAANLETALGELQKFLESEMKPIHRLGVGDGTPFWAAIVTWCLVAATGAAAGYSVYMARDAQRRTTLASQQQGASVQAASTAAATMAADLTAVKQDQAKLVTTLDDFRKSVQVVIAEAIQVGMKETRHARGPGARAREESAVDRLVSAYNDVLTTGSSSREYANRSRTFERTFNVQKMGVANGEELLGRDAVSVKLTPDGFGSLYLVPHPDQPGAVLVLPSFAYPVLSGERLVLDGLQALFGVREAGSLKRLIRPVKLDASFAVLETGELEVGTTTP